jgi:hypothetical protein
MLGIAFIVIVGLAVTKPLATGDFVVCIETRYNVYDSNDYVVYPIL